MSRSNSCSRALAGHTPLVVKSAKRSDAGPSISSVLELHTDWTGYRVLYTVDAEYSPTSALALPLRQQALLRLVLL